MILHLGNDCFVTLRDVLMVLDYAEAKKSPDTGKALADGEQVSLCGDGDEPKSAIITEEAGVKRVYLSPISSQTLYKRGADENWYKNL